MKTFLHFSALVMLLGCCSLLALVVQEKPPNQSGQEPNSQSANSISQQQKEVVHQAGEKGLTPPKATYTVPAGYSEKARKARVQGRVGLRVVVTSEGKIGDVTVVKKLHPDLDEKAVEAVRKWTFEPATKDGQPVAVQINVNMQFALY
jgi:TonB family protein